MGGVGDWIPELLEELSTSFQRFHGTNKNTKVTFRTGAATSNKTPSVEYDMDVDFICFLANFWCIYAVLT